MRKREEHRPAVYADECPEGSARIWGEDIVRAQRELRYGRGVDVQSEPMRFLDVMDVVWSLEPNDG